MTTPRRQRTNLPDTRDALTVSAVAEALILWMGAERARALLRRLGAIATTDARWRHLLDVLGRK